LGYSPSEAANAIALASDLEDTSSTPEIIKKALRLLSPKEN
jgi:Holliday junction resolvasome RuvABC DNA-binding subunit